MRRIALLLCLVPVAMGARSVDHYPVANGIGSAAVRLEDGRLDSFRPAPYAALDQGIVTPELAFDAYFAVRQDATLSRWLTEVPVDEVRSVADANAVVIVQRPSSACASRPRGSHRTRSIDLRCSPSSR